MFPFSFAYLEFGTSFVLSRCLFCVRVAVACPLCCNAYALPPIPERRIPALPSISLGLPCPASLPLLISPQIDHAVTRRKPVMRAKHFGHHASPSLLCSPTGVPDSTLKGADGTCSSPS